MTQLEAVECRHSVRDYLDKPIEDDKIDLLLDKINFMNNAYNYNIQLMINTDGVFDVSYGRLHGVKNYIALVGKTSDYIEEELGYYGEELVLYAQTLGLNTCWVVLTYDSSKVEIDVAEDETLVSLIAIGYGENEGRAHISKSIEDVSDYNESDPEWYRLGIECALLAPTALNQQKFFISRNDESVTISTTDDKYTHIDLGIVRYHFELGAGKQNFRFSN